MPHPLPSRRLALAFFVACACACAAPAADVWTALARPGAVLLLRHANAPGVGDPPGFRLDDCATQRNLDAAGRAQARQLGVRLRDKGVQVGAVLSSQWCRARETARLAFGDTLPRDAPEFNSFFGERGAGRDPQTARALATLARWQGPGTLVVVTHQVNITALTGVAASAAEGVVVAVGRDGRLEVLGTLAP